MQNEKFRDSIVDSDEVGTKEEQMPITIVEKSNSECGEVGLKEVEQLGRLSLET